MITAVAKKRFGQNFLIDENVLNNILNVCDIKEDTGVIEIGPGTGNLTEFLLRKAKKLVAFEIDTDLIDGLETRFKDKNFKVYNEDILKVDLNKIISEEFADYKEVIIASNLPYYITTPIILGLLEQKLKVSRYVFMVQDEVADRLTALKGTKDYNSLSVLISYKTNSQKCFKVSPNCFVPAPNVNSAVIKLETKEITKKPLNEAFFFKLNRMIFKQRRKTLYNNLKELNLDKDIVLNIFHKLNFNENIRAEALSLDDIINLADEIGRIL